MATTSALDSANALASAMGTTVTSTGKGDLDKEAFLKLLVTQFQNQDPLNPMEDQEFVSQLAQFTALEQQMATNKNMESLLELQQRSQMLNAASYIGKEVSARGSGVSVMDGVVSELLFAPSEEVATCTANIWDSSNNLVAAINLGSCNAGIHSLNWDGKKLNGQPAANGVYTVTFSAENAQGKAIVVDTSVSGTVVGVSTSDNEQILRLSDGRYVALSNVRELVQAGTISGENTIAVGIDGKAQALSYRLTSDMLSGRAEIYSGNNLVATVALDKQNAGLKTFEWNAKNSNDEAVTPGTYTVKIVGYGSNGSTVPVEYLGASGEVKTAVAEETTQNQQAQNDESESETSQQG